MPRVVLGQIVALRNRVVNKVNVEGACERKIVVIHVHLISDPFTANVALVFLRVRHRHKRFVKIGGRNYLQGVLVDHGVSEIVTVGRVTMCNHQIAVLEESDTVCMVDRQRLAAHKLVALAVGPDYNCGLILGGSVNKRDVVVLAVVGGTLHGIYAFRRCFYRKHVLYLSLLGPEGGCVIGD